MNNLLANIGQFLWDHRTKLVSIASFVLLSVLQQKAIDPSFISAHTTFWLTLAGQILSGGGIAIGVGNTIAARSNQSQPPIGAPK